MIVPRFSGHEDVFKTVLVVVRDSSTGIAGVEVRYANPAVRRQRDRHSLHVSSTIQAVCEHRREETCWETSPAETVAVGRKNIAAGVEHVHGHGVGTSLLP